MKNLDAQYVKVTRPDGAIQYFERNEDGFHAIGGGFNIKSFAEGSKVEDIAEVPENLTIGYIGFGEPAWRGITDVNDKWNGWDCPYIFAEDAPLLLAYFNTAEYAKSKVENGVLTFVDECNDEPVIFTVEKTVVAGIECYYVGDWGYCFQFYKSKENAI